jgi:hypothetical protein
MGYVAFLDCRLLLQLHGCSISWQVSQSIIGVNPMARPTTKPSITLAAPKLDAAVINIPDWESEFNSVLTMVVNTSESGAKVASMAVTLYLEKSDLSGMKALYDIATGRYTVAYQGKDYEKAKNIAAAWASIYDQSSRKLNRHGFSLRAISLRSVGSGMKTASLEVITKHDAAAIKRDEEREKKERIEAKLKEHKANEAAAAYDAMKSMDAAAIAAALRPMLMASGATITDVIVALCEENGQEVRQLGRGLARFESLAEKAEKAEKAAANRAKQAAAKKAAQAAAKQAAQTEKAAA